MLSRIFPKQIDNTYRGYWLAIWLLVPIVLLKFFMGLNVAGLNPWISNRFVAKTADGIPLESFGAEAASTVMFLFASWGLILLVLSLLGIVVLIRYRAMVPLMYLLLSIEQIGRMGISLVSPVVKVVKVVETGDISVGFFGQLGTRGGTAHRPRPVTGQDRPGDERTGLTGPTTDLCATGAVCAGSCPSSV